MTERKILFRGFHLNKKGNTVIRLNGKKIKGEWLYWEVHGMLVNKQTKIAPLTYVKLIFNFELVEETVGQWVATDKNGKDVFEGDIVKCRYESYTKVWYETYEVIYYNFIFGLKTLDDKHFIPFGNSTHRACEVIGNKWESEVMK